MSDSLSDSDDPPIIPSSKSIRSGTQDRGSEYAVINVLLAAMLALGSFAVYELGSFFGKTLSQPAEFREAIIAREMLLSKDYVVPTLAGADQFKKPPLSYWLAAYSAKLFFPGAEIDAHRLTRAAQFPPAVCAALAVFVTALFGSLFFGRTGGIVSGLVLASTALAVRYAQVGFCDASLMLFCAASACGFSRILLKEGGLLSALFAGIALGLGVLTKSHIALVLLGVPLLLEMILRRKSLTLKNWIYVATALAIAVAVAAPWFVMVEKRHPGAWNELVSEANREIWPAAANSGEQPLTTARFLYLAAKGLFPWSPIAILGLLALLSVSKRPGTNTQSTNVHARFFLVYFAVGFFLLLFTRRKQEYSLLPLLPAFAICAGAYVARLNAPGGFVEERMGWLQLWFGLLAAILIACAPWLPPIMERLREFGAYAALIAIGVFVVNFYCARQWVGARGLSVATAIAALTLLVSARLALRPAELARQSLIWRSIDKVNETLEADYKDAPVYAPELDDSLVHFYIGRQPGNFQKLPSDTFAPNSSIVILMQGDSLKNAAKIYKFQYAPPPGETNAGFSTLILTENSPQLADIRAAIKAWESQNPPAAR